jgi:heme/copper-type cytochrome/quinol oxidase subunit 2
MKELLLGMLIVVLVAGFVVWVVIKFRSPGDDIDDIP